MLVLLLACDADRPLEAVAGLGRWEHTTTTGVGIDLYLPGAPPPPAGRPLMVVLHGCAQTPADLEARADWERVSETFGAVIGLPAVPNGGRFAGCWDYYGPSHSRAAGDAGRLLDLVEALTADPQLAIDAERVSIAGLSSGGGMAMVMGCLAPDVFAGVGIAAGPTVGTSAFQAATVGTTLQAATGVCTGLAGTHADAFDTQLVAVIAGTSDYIVAQGYADLNADVFAAIYASQDRSSFPVTALEGYQPRGTGTLYADADGPRISLIHATGMGHAWPAGTGPGPEIAFVASEGVDFGWTLADFFARYSRRTPPVDLPEPPVEEPEDEDEPEDELPPADDDGCEPWVERVEDDINGHLSRYAVYPAGYGVADETYVDLVDTFGVFDPFTLYLGSDGDWYLDPAELPPNGC